VKFARYVAAVASIVAIIAVVAVLPARAQQPVAPTLAINQVDTSNYPQMGIIVTALDGRGVPATGLKAAQFQVSDGGASLPVASVKAAQDDGLRLATVIAIDTSGSMAGAPFQQAQQAATNFVNSMGPNDEAAIVAFSGAVNVAVPLTSNHQTLANGIALLSAAGNTSLYGAVQASAFAAASAATPRRAVILLTDGENDTQTSQATSDDSINAALGSGAPFFTIGMGASPDTAYLQSLATQTQGQYSAATTATLADVYVGIATLLRNQYVLTVQGAGSADGSAAQLQIIATIDGAPAAATASFNRGTAPVVAAPAPATAAPAAAAAPKPPGKKSALPATIFAAVIIIIGLAIGGFLLARWNRRRRTRLAQLRVIAPNLRQAAAQPLDVSVRTPGATYGTAGAAVLTAPEVGTGFLREKNGTGQVYALGAGPAILGTSPRACTIVLPPSDQIAGEHLRIWLRDGHYTLHHVGGMSRKTFVGGREADWLVLEPGDEVIIGSHKLIFEDAGAPAR
jgi:VWFA-related protein